MQYDDRAMSAAHTLIGYFLSSTQASGHLIEAQGCGLLVVYEDCKAVQLIQDVAIWWWSTWCMLCCLYLLTPTISLLLATNKVDCVELTPIQWVSLHQTEITLVTMDI